MRSFCDQNPEACFFADSTGFGTTFSNLIYNAPAADPNDNTTPVVIPNCSSPADDYERAWCAGHAPAAGAEYGMVHKAIVNIMNLGGDCGAIGNALSASLQMGYIRIYSQSSYTGFSGAAPTGGSTPQYGGLGSAYSWVAISDYWTTKGFDSMHPTAETPPRDLQQVLAHEGDHLLGADHLPGDPNSTPHSSECSGIGS